MDKRTWTPWLASAVALSLVLSLLSQPALAQNAAVAPVPAETPQGPEQLSGSAAGREHEVSAEQTDATGTNSIDAGDLAVDGDALPLEADAAPFTPIEPEIGSQEFTQQSDTPTATEGSGFDPDLSVELPGQRTRWSKEFENPDGTTTTQVYPEPVHFQGEDGTWQEIDTDLVPDAEASGAQGLSSGDGTRLAMAAEETDLTLSSEGNSPDLAALGVSEDGEHSVTFGVDGASDVVGSVQEDTVHYEGVRPDADLTLQAGPGMVKETIILNSPDAPREWAFPLELNGLTPELDDQGAVLFKDAEGQAQAVVPTGWMEDSSQDPETGGPAVSGDVGYRLEENGGQWSLVVVLDDTWLDEPDRVYPVQVDPSVADIDTSGDSFVQDGWPTTNYSGDDELKVGSYDGGTNRAISYMKFSDVTSRLDNRYILNADLVLFNHWSSKCDPREVRVHQVTESWSATTVTWNNRPSDDSSPVAAESFAHGETCGGSEWESIDLGRNGVDLVQGWVDGSETNHGLSIQADFNSSYTWKRFGSRQSANPPYMAITHSAWGASYDVGSLTEPVTGGQGGEVDVTVTNLGDFDWEPQGWNELRLGTRVRDKATGDLMEAVAFTRLDERLTPGDSTTLDARIPELPPGDYLLNFDMQRLRDQTWLSDKSVPVSTVSVTSLDVGPRLTDVYPRPGGQIGSLTPSLFADAESIDDWPADATVEYWFEVCDDTDGEPTGCVDSGWQDARTWAVPAGTLAWGEQFLWRVQTREGTQTSPASPYYPVVTAVEQPAITRHLGGVGLSGAGRDVDPLVGNYTTTATDAEISSVGPALSVNRTYNSRDPRTDNVFGAGWSTRFDMRVEPDDDGSGNVVVTYPNGRQVRFGQNPDGTYAPPFGSFATLTTTSEGGWRLSDKNQTSYAFDTDGRIIEVTDFRGRAQSFDYTADGTLAGVSNPGGRSLHFTWDGAHVSSVSTDAPDSGTEPLTWSYTYDGDRLTQVCGPEDADGACTTYTYTDGSHYRTVVHDAGPIAHWRFGEDQGSGNATSDLLLDDDRHTGSYQDVQLGTAGALQGSPETAATFNGASSHVQLPDWLVTDTPYLTVELWFRTTGDGVLFSYQDHSLEEATSGSYTPALYVGTDGKLRGQFWNGTAAPITSSAAVNDGAWHHAALTASGNSQSLYLDGAVVDTVTGEITQNNQRYVYAGAGYWRDWPATSGETSHFSGDMDEVAVYGRPLGAQTVAEHHAAGTVSQKLTEATLPSGRTQVQLAHDAVHDRVSEYTDSGGATYQVSDHTLTGAEESDDQETTPEDPTVTVTVTDPDDRDSSYTYDPLNGHRLLSQTDVSGNTATFAYDTGGFLAATTAPDGTVTRTGRDERGNKVSQTTCRDAADEQSCSTSYYDYFLNADDPLDPRNDQLTAERDARSSGPSDDTYLTTYGYNSHGDRVSTTTPATSGFPEGRSTTQTFTDGTEAAVGGGTVPAGLLLTATDAKGGTSTYAYSATGDLARVTAPNGLVDSHTYDALGRETSSTVVTDGRPDGVTTTYAYDGESRLVSTTGPATTNAVTGDSHQASTTYTYDADGRVLTETVADLAGVDEPRTTTHTYDTHGRLAVTTDAENQKETYTYDTYGHQATRTTAGGETFRYTYTPSGDLAEIVLTGYTGHPDDPQPATDVVLDSYAYDPVGRLAEHTDAMGRTTRYTYYDDGLTAQETRVGFREQDGSTRDIVLASYTYDAAGHLTRETTGNGTVTTAYETDAAGRTTAAVLDPDGLARRTSYTHDATGAVLTEALTGAGGTRTEKVTYQRDATGAWTSRTVDNGTEDLTTTRVLDQRGLVLSETTPGGATTEYGYDVLGNLTTSRSPAVGVEEWNTAAVTARPTTTLGYNAFGELTHEQDERGHTTSAVHDRLGRTVSTTLPDYTPDGSGTALTSTISTTYDNAGRIASETDPLGGTTTYAYDQLGNPARITEPPAEAGGAAPVTTLTHDLLGEQLSVTGPTGARTEATYDDLGRQITLTEIERHPTPAAHTTTYAYDDAGNRTSTTTPAGVSTSTAFDASGQPVTRTDGAGQSTVYAYGPTGLATSVTDPAGTTVRTSHDLAGRPTDTTIEDASGATLATASTGYDADSRPVTVTDALGHTTTRDYDPIGRVTTLTEPIDDTTSITTTFGYDAAGNRTRLTDGRGNTTWYTFTTHGQLESVIEPATDTHPDLADRTWTTVYDAAGQAIEEHKPGGVVQSTSYDALGRITQVSGSGAETTTQTDTFGYDLAGRPTTVGANSYTYNDRGQILTADGESGTASFSYDADGRLVQRDDAAGTTAFAYDTAGRLDTAADPLTGTDHQYSYDGVGRLDGIVYGDTSAVERSFDYDARGRLVSDSTVAPGPVPAVSVSYAYDDANRITGKTTAGIAGAGENAYTYDHAGRLTGWTDPAGTVTDYTWDASGNRTSAGADAATYDERNRLINAAGTDYTWSPRGTLAQTTEADGTATAFTYDARGRMISDGEAVYFYDALNRLIQRGGQSLRYADQSNNAVDVDGELIARDLDGAPLATTAADGTGATVSISDAHGDVIAAVDPAAGTVTGSRTYTPFGEVTDEQGTPGSLGFQGEYTDPDTGRVNMQARWYDPTTGGFSSRDSWTLNPTPSVQANRYTYGNGTPLNAVDPSGHRVACPPKTPCIPSPRYGGSNTGKSTQGGSGTSGLRAGGRAVGGLAGSVSGAGLTWAVLAALGLVVATPGTTANGSCWMPCYGGNTGRAPWGPGGVYSRPDYSDTRYASGTATGRGYGGYGGSGGGSCSWCGGTPVASIPAGPPPPPPWSEILAAILATEHARPVTEESTDSEHEQFVDDSFTRALDDLELTDSKLKKYFRYFPTFQTAADRRQEFGNYVDGWNDQPSNCLSGNNSWVHYHPLDSQGRATGVTACLSADQIDYSGRGRRADPEKNTEIMGSDTTRKNGDRNSNPAPGWASGDGDDYARGHLLGSQLGGSGRDRRNLVRLHHMANSKVMKSYEDTVRRRLDSGERIFYASVPRYDGGNPVPDTVDLYAVGDRGFYAEWTVYNTEDGMP
ncbi:DNRLRE domain-containing protein [Nocardiopsis aegyptia]|uniref:DNRLRE domain-containing protein n=1 Tax=Nocardiopsis aegyptia TaxID=220378 RepID=UPI00366F297F